MAHRAPRREGPGHIGGGPRGPPCPQVPLTAPRRLQGPHLRRARHRAHHRRRTHHSGHIRRPSRPPPAQQDPTAPHNTTNTDTDTADTDTADTADTDTADTDTADTADTADTDTADTDTADTADTADTDTADTDTADTADTADTDTDTADTADTDTDTADTADTADTDTADTGAAGADAEGFVGLVLADSAYASGEALDAFAAAGYDTAIKPINPKPRITGGFTRDDFTIDTDAQTVTCPAGHTKAVTPSGAARFGALCNGCPLRARCTTSRRGRSVTVDQHHHRRQANKTRWAQPATQGAYRQHRPMAERSIAWLTRNKARRVPYRGVAANCLWLTTRAAAVNLVRLTNLGVTHNNGAFTL